MLVENYTEIKAIGGRHRTHGAASRIRYSLPTYESPRPPYCPTSTDRGLL
nr:MAG TPA: hypothetical protein [Caudoviricetes sp.]